MRYYKILLDNIDENDIVCFCEDSKGFEQYHLEEGVFINNWDKNLTFNFNPDEGSYLKDYLANDLGWFLVSSKLKNILKQFDKDEIQYLPVKIVNSKDNSQIEGYSVANILNVIDVLNLEHSDYSVIEIDDEKIYSIKKYAINKNALSNNHIFKIKGFEIPRFVSETLKISMKVQEITGYELLEVKTI